MKKLFSIILILVLVFCLFSPVFAEEALPGKIWSDAGLVCDLKTGEVIYSLNADTRMYPASTTKMLTGILAIENLNLDEVITVDKEAAGIGGNTLSLKNGEKIVAKDLLYGTLVISANDGAVALAKAISGSVEEFAKLMNKKAAELGMTGTNFVNPNGLHDDNHYTTARDLSKLAVYCMKNETFREIVKLSSYTVPATNLSEERTVETTNWLLNDEVDSHRVYVGNEYRYCKYDGCIGIKTGNTLKAGSCIVAAAEKNGTEVLAIALHAANPFDRFSDAIKLLDFGFSGFQTLTSIEEGAELGTVRVKKGSVRNVDVVLSESIYSTLKKGESNSIISTEITLDEKVKAPVTKGQKLGVVRLYKSGELLKEYDAIAKDDVPEGGFLSNFGIPDSTAKVIFKVLKIILIILVLIILALAAYVFYERRRIAKKRARKAARLRAKIERENLNKSDIKKDDI